MADIVSSASPVKKIAAAKKSKVPAAHPPFALMIVAALKALKDRTGSSRQAILKYICANYKVTADKAGVHLKMALKRGVTGGLLKMARSSGKGAGSYKLGDKAKEVKKPKTKKPAVKKTEPKKPAAKKATDIKKTAAKKATDKKKTAAKKATDTTKTSVKKATDKLAKPAKKSADKKPAVKKTAVKKSASKKSASKNQPTKKPAATKTSVSKK